MTEQERQLRDQLIHLLRGGSAHLNFDDLVADFPGHLINKKFQEVPYTAWQVLEHLRIAQWDIIEFARNPSYVSPPFPEGYWPASDVQATTEMWNRSVEAFKRDSVTMQELLNDSSVDLFARIPHGDGQTWLRQALLIADHNAYHFGTLALLKRLLV